MAKKIIIIVVSVILIGFSMYIGIRNDMERGAAIAAERESYVVNVMQNTEYGYIPKYDFEKTKSSFETIIVLSWWEATWTDNGDLLIGFDAGDETWFVKLEREDPEIDRIRMMVDDYGLKCKIPSE